jgi:hypothetical protein
MTEGKYRKTVERLGGAISSIGVVDFPDTLRINSKKDALDLMDVLINVGDFTISLDTPFEKLREAIKRGIA